MALLVLCGPVRRWVALARAVASCRWLVPLEMSLGPLPVKKSIFPSLPQNKTGAVYNSQVKRTPSSCLDHSLHRMRSPAVALAERRRSAFEAKTVRFTATSSR
jgi:hypothetical protein